MSQLSLDTAHSLGSSLWLDAANILLLMEALWALKKSLGESSIRHLFNKPGSYQSSIESYGSNSHIGFVPYHE